ncbi:MAG: hypothetical protein IKE51_04125, partial [Solobacterium sp.]|nr:hypothetical protein [Solobacterium sp.]
MKQLSKVFLSLFMFLSYSPMLMNANAEEESPDTTEIPIEIEKTPHEEEIKVMEEEVMDELPKYVDSFIDWIDKETYPDLIHNATGNVYVQMRVKDASYEGMKEAMPKTIY